jgi:hypothetical protein
MQQTDHPFDALNSTLYRHPPPHDQACILSESDSPFDQTRSLMRIVGFDAEDTPETVPRTMRTMHAIEAKGHLAKHGLHRSEGWSFVLDRQLPIELQQQAETLWILYKASRSLDDAWQWALRAASGHWDMAADLLLYHLLLETGGWGRFIDKSKKVFDQVESKYWAALYLDWSAHVNIQNDHSFLGSIPSLARRVKEQLFVNLSRDPKLKGRIDFVEGKGATKKGQLLPALLRIQRWGNELKDCYTAANRAEAKIPSFLDLDPDFRQSSVTMSRFLIAQSQQQQMGLNSDHYLKEFEAFMVPIEANHPGVVESYVRAINNALEQACERPRHRESESRDSILETYLDDQGTIVFVRPSRYEYGEHLIVSGMRKRITAYGPYSKLRALEEAKDILLLGFEAARKPYGNKRALHIYTLETW